MTRDEAIPGLDDILRSMERERPWEKRRCLLVNGMIQLGMLKLDEPKSATEQFRSAVRNIGVHLSELTVLTALDRAGLKIVEK